jgi:hypothetical protein
VCPCEPACAGVSGASTSEGAPVYNATTGSLPQIDWNTGLLREEEEGGRMRGNRENRRLVEEES